MNKDTLNYKGSSLFEAYKALWDAIHDYDTGITPTNKAVEHAFNYLSTFPFDKVCEIMTDYVRKLVKQQLGLTYLPYTKQQQQALSNLLDKYPTTEQEKQQIQQLMTVARKLIDVLPELPTTEALVSHTTILGYIDQLTEQLYKLEVRFLWIVSESVAYALAKAKTYLGRENVKVETAIDYINLYHKRYGKPEKTLEQQLVEDISVLMMYNYPHPQMVLALENAEKVLDLYYTETDASKLFVDDMRYKIKRYIGHATEVLGSHLIQWFRQPPKVETEEPETTVEQQYQDFLTKLNHYQMYGDNLQAVLEAAKALKLLPYQQVAQLPNFITNMNIADNLQPFPGK